MNFFLWYYSRGWLDLFRWSKNFIRYPLYRANVGSLLSTLLSPWRRDVSYRNWRGLHPFLALQSIFNNILSRFLGMIVRMGVIVYGMVWFLWNLVFGVSVVVLYTLTPIFLLLALIFSQTYPLWTMSIASGALLVFIRALLAWRVYYHRERSGVDPQQAVWFPRALGRLGLLKQDIPRGRLAEQNVVTHALERLGVKPEAFTAACEVERRSFERRAQREDQTQWEFWKRTPPIGEQWIYGYTPKLDQYARDISVIDSSEYAHLIPFERESVLERMLLALGRPTGNNVLLIGEPGIGKKTIVHVLARQIREQALTEEMLVKFRVLLLDVGQILSDGQANQHDPKDWLRTMLTEALLAGNIILIVENLDMYLNPNGDYRVGDIFHEFLDIPASRLIGLMTPAAHHELTRLQVPVLKYFEPIQLEEPTAAGLRNILVNYFEPLEKKRVVFTLDALDEIIRAAEKYNWETPFPERAIDLAEETLLYWERDPKTPFVDVSVVNAFLSLKSGVPIGEVTIEEKDKLLNLEERLHERIVGQHEAVRQLAEAFRKARAGLGNEKRPVGSFLFLGPTGVGKTETAKALAAVYFGNEENMVRLDMSEFQTQESIHDLIGSTEGSDTPGRLTNLVQEHPFSILLLDELEKAHAKVLDVFLQILDEGFVTDAFGHKVSFRNLIIIATSNAGAAVIHQATTAGQSMQQIEKDLIQTIINERTFRPEFLNRFDGVVLFNALTHEEIVQVTSMKLENFATSLKASKDIRVIFPQDVISAIATRGYDPAFGVRSINRYISDVVEDRFVRMLLAGEVQKGSTVTLTLADLV